MNIDIRKIICATMATMNYKTNTKTICWDHITKYIELLEDKFKTKINLIYEDDFNEEEYNNLITSSNNNTNMFFTLNSNHNYKSFNNIINEELLLSKKLNEELVNWEISTQTDEVIKQNRLKQILNELPNNNISFVGTFKLFMLRYSQKVDNKVDKNKFWETMNNLNTILNEHNIKIEDCNKLELFRITSGQYETHQKYNVTDTDISLEILDINKFHEELAVNFNKQSFIFMTKLIDWIIEYNFIKNNETKKVQNH